MKQIERRCQCDNMRDILCGNNMDAEDLLCPACREGCNMAVTRDTSLYLSGSQVMGTHFSDATITLSEGTIKL